MTEAEIQGGFARMDAHIAESGGGGRPDTGQSDLLVLG